MVCNVTPLQTLLSAQRKSSRKSVVELLSRNVLQEVWVSGCSGDQVDWVDPVVLGGSRDTGVFVGEGGEENGWEAVVVEFLET